MKVGSLFSGGGLGDFGFMAAGMEIAWQVEIDEYCQKILALRYPESKKYTDIKELKGGELEKVDIITGGFPCQPFSVAGKRKGQDDNRYLWPEMLRVIKECRPRWVVGENVPGIVNMALDTVCSDLESEGYEVWPIIFPSHALGAWHKRDRLWIVGHSRLFRPSEHEKQTTGIKQSSKIISNSPDTRIKGVCQRENSTNENVANQKFSNKRSVGKSSSQNIPDTSSKRRKPWTNNGGENGQEIRRSESNLDGIERRWESWWQSEPAVGRVAYGIADRVHRLKMLGNGQVPACTYVIGKMIIEIEQNV